MGVSMLYNNMIHSSNLELSVSIETILLLNRKSKEQLVNELKLVNSVDYLIHILVILGSQILKASILNNIFISIHD